MKISFLSNYVYLFIFLSIYLSISQNIYLSIYISIYLPICYISVKCSYTTLSIQLYRCLSVFLSFINYLSFYYLSICENICPLSTHNHFNSTLLMSIYLSISTYLPFYLYFYLDHLSSFLISIYLSITYLSF